MLMTWILSERSRAIMWKDIFKKNFDKSDILVLSFVLRRKTREGMVLCSLIQEKRGVEDGNFARHP